MCTRTTPSALVDELGKKGIVVKLSTDTVEQIAKSNGKEPKEVLGDILSLFKGAAVDKD